MQVKRQLLGLPSYKPGKPIDEVKKELGLTKVIKLASNENPFGASPKAAEAIRELAANTAIYPDGYAAVLREKVAQKIGVAQEQLIFGNGSDEIIQFLCRALLDENTNTVTADPTFSQYKLNATIEGAEVREIACKEDGTHDLEAMLAAIDENTRIVWVCNPNNPSGTYIDKASFEQFMKSVPADVLVVSDEAYYEYAIADDFPQSIPLLKTYKNLIVLRTFSKAYGLAALRVGYGVGDADFIAKLDPVRPPFNNTTFAHAAAAAALDDDPFIAECVQKNREGMKLYEAFCEEQGLTYYSSQANFILIDFGRSGDEVFDYLLKRGFIIRSGEALGFPTCARITVGSQEENEEILSILKEMLQTQPIGQK